MKYNIFQIMSILDSALMQYTGDEIFSRDMLTCGILSMLKFNDDISLFDKLTIIRTEILRVYPHISSSILNKVVNACIDIKNPSNEVLNHWKNTIIEEYNLDPKLFMEVIK